MTNGDVPAGDAAASSRSRKTDKGPSRTSHAAVGEWIVTMVDQFPHLIGQEGVGFVVTVKDSFGFVKTVDEDLGQIFFHVTEVLEPKPADNVKKPDLRQLLRVGDEIEFIIEPSRYDDGKLHAKKVKKLPSGTLKVEHVHAERHRGRVRCRDSGELFIVHTIEDSLGQGSQDVKLRLQSKDCMIPGSPAPQPGDVVEYNVVTDKMRNTNRACNIEVIAATPSEEELHGRSLGYVVSLSEGGGQIRELLSKEVVSFQRENVSLGGKLEKLTLNSEVAFKLQRATPAPSPAAAVDVTLLPPGTVSSQDKLGTHHGKVMRLPSNGPGNPQDGIVMYTHSGSERRAAFGFADVYEFVSSLSEGDEVEFELVKNRFLDHVTAHAVTLVLKHGQGTELGSVSMLKKNFGFIKCCTRIVDVFFHVNALKPDSPPLEPDSDVRFVPTFDRETQKVVASQLEVVPAGTAVFQTLSAEAYEGSVKITCGLPKGHTPGTSGVIVAHVDGRAETLPYSHQDVCGLSPPGKDQKVMFRILEDRKAVTLNRKAQKTGAKVRTGGRRAVEVQLVPTRPTPIPVPVAAGRRGAARAAESASSVGAAAAPSPMLASSPARALEGGEGGRREKGSVIRLFRKVRGQGCEPFGVVRTQEMGSWSKVKSGGGLKGAAAEGGDGGASAQSAAISKASGLDVRLLPGDVVFWLSDVCEEHRDALAKSDEVEFSTGVRALPGGDAGDDGAEAPFELKIAFRVVRVRAHRPRSAGPPAALPAVPSPGSAPAGPRRTMKFVGTAAVQVPGPQKGDRGFSAGRGRPLPDQKERVSSFRLESTLAALAFVPSSASADNLRAGMDSPCGAGSPVVVGSAPVAGLMARAQLAGGGEGGGRCGSSLREATAAPGLTRDVSFSDSKFADADE